MTLPKTDPPLWQIALALLIGGGGAILAYVCAVILMFPAS